MLVLVVQVKWFFFWPPSTLDRQLERFPRLFFFEKSVACKKKRSPAKKMCGCKKKRLPAIFLKADVKG
jgi:hypothetical protein